MSAPTVRTLEDLTTHDGKDVTLVGTYRRFAVPVRMGRPPKNMGHAAVWIGEQECIRIGKGVRDQAERDQFDGQLVAVFGKLVMSPPPAEPEWVAQPDPDPTIFPSGAIRAAD